MTTMPMSIRKYLKNMQSKKRINFEDDASRIATEVILREQGYVSVQIAGYRAIWHPDSRVELYRWCHAQLKTRNWVRITDQIWFTNDEHRAMFMLQWSGR